MSTPDNNSLFHGSGSQELLNYFFSRLQACDISLEEALAIMSAVYADLGKRSSTGPRLYQLYSGAMKSLQHSIPDVYDYVVSTWNRRNKSESTDVENRDSGHDEDVKSEIK